MEEELEIISRVRPVESYVGDIVRNEQQIRTKISQLSQEMKDLPSFGPKRFYTDADITRLSACLVFAGLEGK